ncbi:MAG: phospholipase [Dehalococcoidia bacterium]|nr:phospholipase [Dehalococcoidia bacterium]
MRRLSSVALLLAVLAVLAVFAVTAGAPSGVSAQEGHPDDYCTQSPDRPLGWLFTDACRGHDECLEALGPVAEVVERLACDDAFLEALLDAPSALHDGVCSRSPMCQVIARIYHFVVRLVTLEFVPPNVPATPNPAG